MTLTLEAAAALLPPCLLPEELEALTKRIRPSAQRRVLDAIGIRHYTRGKALVVFRDDVLGIPRDPHPFYGLLRPIDWWEDNREKLLLSLGEMRRRSQAWMPSAPDECGVYFLFFEGNLQYVGKSLSLARRFHEHESRRTVPVDAASWVLCPEQFVVRLERDYWDAYKPMYNWKAPQ